MSVSLGLASEPEGDELLPGPLHRFDMTRREFLKALGGGIVVVCCLKDSVAQERGGRGLGARMPQDLGAWLHIGEEGQVTVCTGKVELGQNIRTSLTQAVAEELHVPLISIRLVMGDTDLTPFDMGTFGSLTTPTMAPQLRRAAASARELLIDLAAEQWKVERSSLAAADGKVTHPPTKRSSAYGELTKAQKLVKTISSDIPLTPPGQWRIAGQSVPKVTGREIVTGQHRYASDVRRPGMLVGKVLRPPSFNATLVSLDVSAAEAMGVTVVRDGSFVGVAASTEHLAARALQAIRAEWRPSAQPSQQELFEDLRKNSFTPQGGHTQGSIEQGFAGADLRLGGTYTVAYIAHAPLEPRAAVAEWENGRLMVWTGTQRPFGVRSELAQAFHLPEDRVHVIVPDTGAGFGGKQTGETAVEAARLAKAAGKPVKVVWTREEEFTWAYFRPAGVIEVRSGVTEDGGITAWEFRNYNSGAAAIRTPYDIPNQKIEFYPARSPLRQGSYRALAATANHFARETHMDELAEALKMDPVQFRLRNSKDPRLRAVLEAATQHFSWGKVKRAEGRGFGVASGFEKASYVATCAEVLVERSTDKVKVVRIVTAFDCGAIVNPDHLRNQIEGCAMMGLGGALFEAIEYGDGKILNPRFSDYRVPRFSDLPVLETVLLDRKDVPSAGGGETPIVPIAPAIGNALFDATGVRHRALPMAPTTLVSE